MPPPRELGMSCMEPHRTHINALGRTMASTPYRPTAQTLKSNVGAL